MFGTQDNVIRALESLINQLKSDEIRVVNVATEGGIWVNGECVQFTVSLSFLSNGYEDEDGDKKEIDEGLNRAIEDAGCDCD